MKPKEISLFKQKAMQWAASFEVCCCLNSNNFNDSYAQHDFIIAVGAEQELKSHAGNAFVQLQSFYQENKTWLFGLLSYELKNEIENLNSTNIDELKFPDLYFFVPKYLIAINNQKIEVLKGDASVLQKINEIILTKNTLKPNLKLKKRFSKKDYLTTINHLKEHIKRGDVYEINFCQEFFAKNANINPLAVYQQLNEVSPTPFSGFFKIYEHYILSATPERFLCKRQQKLISQPIKGTAKRSNNTATDQKIKLDLKNSLKEQAENVMIVDLVRNDLTKSALKGSVKVEELFGIYSFAQVHQMISTVSCQLNPTIDIITAIKNTFPMGSMTGAPKVKAMELIAQYEKTNRGAFSGSFGCINPNGDFDFNVIIRSILYNQKQKYLSFQVGGAITYAANAQQEYEECMLKASAILEVLL